MICSTASSAPFFICSPKGGRNWPVIGPATAMTESRRRRAPESGPVRRARAPPTCQGKSSCSSERSLLVGSHAPGDNRKVGQPSGTLTAACAVAGIFFSGAFCAACRQAFQPSVVFFPVRRRRRERASSAARTIRRRSGTAASIRPASVNLWPSPGGNAPHQDQRNRPRSTARFSSEPPNSEKWMNRETQRRSSSILGGRLPIGGSQPRAIARPDIHCGAARPSTTVTKTNTAKRVFPENAHDPRSSFQCRPLSR